MSLLVVCDHDRGTLTEASLEALTFGRPLAAAAGIEIAAVVIGEGAERAAADLGAHGASTVHLASHGLLTDFGPEAWGETVTQLVRATAATAVLACGTDRGNEVVAQVAARLDEPFVANCRSIRLGAGDWAMTRVQWGGSLLEDVTLSAGVFLVTVAHHAVEATPAEVGAAGVVVPFSPDLDDALAHTIVADRVVLTRGITLSTAPVVVGGGRGVGSEVGRDLFGALPDNSGGHLNSSRGCQGAPEGEGLQRGLGDGAAIMVADDEQAHESNPSSSSRSTTAGAASGPVPRITVSLTVSSGRCRRILAWPPGATDRSSTATLALLEAKRPFIVG